LLYNNGDSSTHDHVSTKHRLNKLQSEMREIRDMSKATDDRLKGLGEKVAMEIKWFPANISLVRSPL
jgi:hypothetical protein